MLFSNREHLKIDSNNGDLKIHVMKWFNAIYWQWLCTCTQLFLDPLYFCNRNIRWFHTEAKIRLVEYYTFLVLTFSCKWCWFVLKSFQTQAFNWNYVQLTLDSHSTFIFIELCLIYILFTFNSLWIWFKNIQFLP